MLASRKIVATVLAVAALGAVGAQRVATAQDHAPQGHGPAAAAHEHGYIPGCDYKNDPQECKRIHDQYSHNDDELEATFFVSDNDIVSPPKMPCYNSAKGAYYIVNVYAYGSTSAGGYGDRYTTSTAEIRDKVTKADYRLDQSSNVDQHYRVLCTAAGDIDVWKMQIDPCKDGTCSTISEFDARRTGYDNFNHKNPNYIYFYWIDNDPAKTPGIGRGGSGCIHDPGQGTACPPGNVTTGYYEPGVPYGIRVPYDTRSGNDWTGYTWAHETTHSLDAVYTYAPHGTNKGHCGDGRHWHTDGAYYHWHDLMCYNDEAADFVPTDNCTTEKNWWVDCNKDDYYKPGSGAPAYLADTTGTLRVFNTARSLWLSSICSEATQESPLSCQQTDGRTN